MPIVISDASVLIDLGAVGMVDLLRDFFSEVFVPPAVWREVTSSGNRPGAFETQKASNEGWLHVRAPSSATFVLELKHRLDDGEAEAIALASEFPESLLLLDDSEARATALRLGLDFTGTVGILLRAKKTGHISALKPILDLLIQDHGFRLSRKIYQQLLKQIAES